MSINTVPYPGGNIRPTLLKNSKPPQPSSFPPHPPMQTTQTNQVTYGSKPVTGTLTLKSTFSEPNFGNDYSSNFVKTGVLPQRWVRNIEDPHVGYPRLQKLHDLKADHYNKYAKPPISVRCSESQIPDQLNELAKQDIQFDVVMVHGCFDGGFSYTDLKDLCISKLVARPSLIYLWVPASKISDGRKLLEKWGFRHGEDITFLVNSLDSVYAPNEQNSWSKSDPLFQSTSWHCLMGLRGTLRRSTDTNLINCNVNTDVIIENPHSTSRNAVPEECYKLVENFTSMARKLHVLPKKVKQGLCVQPRKGWVIISPDTFTIGDLEPKDFRRRKLIPVNPEVDTLRPQTPPPTR